jgi:pSer/pThr/pTyr-binding forkhead associated (FHA) protein
LGLDWLFGRFRRSRGNRRGVRRGGPKPRDRHSHTEMVSAPSALPPLPADLYPPPPPPLAHQPPPPVYNAPPVYNPPPVYAPPVQQPTLQQQAPLAVQVAIQPAVPSDAGQTRIITAPAAPRGPVVAVLIGIGGRLVGDVYKVHDGENRMGRLRSADIPLDGRDDTISREHALIIHQDGVFGLRPLRSDNPTFVNGEPIEEGTPLSDGDQIKVGQSTFRFRKA